MSVLYIMLPVALLIAGGAIYAFVRAALAGQFDDLDTPALRVLPEDTVTRAAGDGRSPGQEPADDRRGCRAEEHAE